VHHRDENRAILDTLVADIAAGELHPVEPAVMPLDRAADALRDQIERRVTGKVALVP
jgi:NADPH2:quinone reductase